MDLSELTEGERLALGGLIRLLVRSDGDFTEEEEAEIGRLGDRLGVGEAGLWRVISASAQAYPEDAAIREAALAVTRDAARSLILEALREIAAPDGIADEEVALLDWLESSWGPG